MVSRLDRYRACAATCTAIDLVSAASVRHYNRASDQMRTLVAEAYQAGPEAVAQLLPLLDESPANRWLAYQLLDLGRPPPTAVDRCLSIIRGVAMGEEPADATGAAMWLREWQARQAESGAEAVPRG